MAAFGISLVADLCRWRQDNAVGAIARSSTLIRACTACRLVS
jgi:hypothetical protein